MTQSPDTLDRARIEALIPHAGAMCLLDRVERWDGESIDCRTGSHLRAGNPLQVDGRVPAEAGIEYAAQAMAVHGGLGRGEGGEPRRGFVAVVNRVEWTTEWLDGEPGELVISARLRQGGDDGRQYAFRIERGGQALVEGEALVMLEARA